MMFICAVCHEIISTSDDPQQQFLDWAWHVCDVSLTAMSNVANPWSNAYKTHSTRNPDVLELTDEDRALLRDLKIGC